MEQCLCRLEKKDDLIFDLTDVEFFDTAGRYLLALLKEQGARFITGSPLIEEIVDGTAQPSLKSAGSGRILAVILLLACLQSTGMPAIAQEAPTPLDLARTATLARTRNLQIRAGRQAEVAAKSAVDQAKALRYGKVAVDAGYLRLDDPVTIESGPVHLPFLGGIAEIAAAIQQGIDSHS